MVVTLELDRIDRDLAYEVFTKTSRRTIREIISDIVAASEAVSYKSSGSHCWRWKRGFIPVG